MKLNTINRTAVNLQEPNAMEILEVKGKTITVEFFNDNIGNERWTGIAFGESMIEFGETPEKKRAQGGEHIAKRLRFAFTRPLGKHGPRNHSLEGCQTWNFMKEGDIVAGQVFQHSKPLPMMQY
ncbi:hypothetical protein TELCIR_15124 [Teladorsagia circumcincta]|uniref:Uncharacterized protein n=1 Tax=Teladorsagia circumcincta TaxID=45464 RepID=A0A2G9TZB9_TELCI|nr:hypothetical protein TELCIR_15124 [Teladorsagia circumcincta]